MGENSLTEEQKQFLEECENLFIDRYTEKDAEFMKVKTMKLKPPPIIDPWYSQNRRFNNDRNDGNRHSNDRYRYSQDRYNRSHERFRPADDRHVHPRQTQRYKPY